MYCKYNEQKYWKKLLEFWKCDIILKTIVSNIRIKIDKKSPTFPHLNEEKFKNFHIDRKSKCLIKTTDNPAPFNPNQRKAVSGLAGRD